MWNPGRLVGAIATAGLASFLMLSTAEASPTHVSMKVPPKGSGNIHCISVSNCVAPAPSFGKARIIRWNGRSWKREKVPQPEGLTEINAAACSSPDHCLATGGDGLWVNQFIDEWSEGTWTRSSAPRILARGNDIACPSQNNCWIVGERVLSSFGRGTFAQHWNGERWKVVKTPNSRLGRIPGKGPGGATVFVPYGLQSISCSSKADCVAVGRANNGGFAGQTVIRWNGRRWKRERVRLPNAKGYTYPSEPWGVGQTGLWSVSCATPRFCMAVGGGTIAFSFKWNGRRWLRVKTPRFVDRTKYYGAGLDEVACSSPRDCIATGFKASNRPYSQPRMALKWNGRSWRRLSVRGNRARATCDPSGHCVVRR